MRAVLAENEEAEVMDECSGRLFLAELDVPPCPRQGQAEGFMLGFKLAPGSLLLLLPPLAGPS